MIALAKKKPKPFDVILIHKTDRFARNREDSIIYKSLLRKQCNIDVISITEKFDDSPQGKMLEGIMEVVAEFYSANLSKEVMKGMNEQADHGIALGEPPYGYTIDKKTGKFTIYEPEAKVVRYIFDEYINGGSLRSIGIDLRKNGIKMFGKAALKKISKAVGNEGKHKDQELTWRPTTVRNTLRRKTYTGDFEWDGKIIKNNHPAIISREKFELVQAILDKKTTKKSSSEDYLLRGLVSCYECGGSLSQLNTSYTSKTSGETTHYRWLRCSNHVRMGICYSNMQKMSYIENKFLNFLEEISQGKINYNNLHIKISRNNLYEKLKNLNIKLNNFDEQFDRQMEAYQAGIITMEQLKKYKDNLIQEKEKTKSEIEILKKKINDTRKNKNILINKIKETLGIIKNKDCSLQQKKNALKLIIDDIQISKKKDLMKVIFKL